MSLTPPFQLAGRYDVSAEIGHGGHAVVYRAHDRVLDRAVAVKLVREDALSADTLARFRQEVQVMAQLEHAHILHLYDTGTVDGRPYVVMELAPGPTLAERLRREGQLPVKDALEIARDVGLALAHAHAHGIVHRDVKPENILLGSGGAVLADFGIARMVQDASGIHITSTGTTVGTVLYMSPEQLCAERNIDGRSDQYSLACVIYEMLAGVRPHIAATVEGLRVLRVKGEHAPVRAHRPSVPEPVNVALHVALSPMPADRFRTTDDFVVALSSVASSEMPASAEVPRVTYHGPAAPPTIGRRRRTRAAAGALVGALALALAGGVAWVWYGRSSAGTRPTAARAVHVAIGARRNADAELSATVERALEAELGSWPDVDVVERVDRSDPTGVVLAVDAAALEDSVRIMVESRAAGTAPVRRTWVVPRRALATTATAATIVRRSLGGATSDLAPGLDAMPGRSLAALAAYVRGWDLLRAGRLDSAQASLHEAASVAPGFAEASLWAAQSGAWASPNVPSTWKDDAEAAAAGRLLTATDSLHAAALRAMAMRDYPAACRAFGAAARGEPSTFAAWFGLAECARLDTVVVGRGERARFRSSHWAALRAYREAVARAPTSELLSVLFPRVLQTTYAGGSIARHGRGEDGHPYSALPSAAGDSIALVPVDRTAFGGLGRSAVPSTYLAAVRRGRAVALELTASWTRRWPTSSDAWFNRALALELAGRIDGGDPAGSALAALDRARSPAPSALARARIAVAQARLGLRRLDLAGAAATAREAIAGVWPKDSTVQTTLAPLAALVGDVARTEELAAVGELEPSIGSPELAREIRAFEIRAISGACDGLDTLRERLEGRLRVAFAPAELRSQRAAILAPIYRDAVPCLGPSILGEFPATRPIDSVFRSMAVGDTVQAVRLLATLRQRRVGANAASVTWDYLFVESWALAHVGDGKMARAQLATALSDLANMSVYTLDQVAQAAGLRRALGLMAQLEQEAGASGGDAAARWASQSRLLSPTPER